MLKITNHSLPPVRVRSQEMSLWQSVVAEYAIKEAQESMKNDKILNVTHFQDHPMVKGTNLLALTCESNNTIESHNFFNEPNDESTDEEIIAYYSSAFFQMARSTSELGVDPYKDLCKKWGNYYRKFSNKDYCGWETCVSKYKHYGKKYKYIKKYNAFEDNGGQDFGVIDYKLPNDAKVAVIGDWGTGMDDAKHLLEVILKNHSPDAIIHLGDIYYAGTPTECQTNFKVIFDELFNTYSRIPIFTIPGNHDYYSYAYGYYDMVKSLNSSIQSAVQEASYFCLRTEDNGWQFLGMDTGYDDSDPSNAFDTTIDGPELKNNELAWHKDKLENFDGGSILLSHHQLFSGNAKINGHEATNSSYPYLNKYLLDSFRPYFGDKVGAWFWGHEHNQVSFYDGLFGLKIGRLIGASAYEEMKSDNPYASTYPEAPFHKSVAKLGIENDYYNHGFAIIDFSKRSHPKAQVLTHYYQYPSWGKTTPNPIPKEASYMWTDGIRIPSKESKPAIQYGKEIHLNLELGNAFIGKEKKKFHNTREEYYPTIKTEPVKLKILSADRKSGNIIDGDTVQFQTEEASVGSYNILGAWSGIPYQVYYYTSGYTAQNWKIKKVEETSDNIIHEDDAVHLINESHPKFYLCPYLFSGTTYLNLNLQVKANWFIQIPVSDAPGLVKKTLEKLGLDFNEPLFENIKKYLRLSLQNKDAALVACSDPVELERIKTNFLKSKLGLDDDSNLDESLSEVCNLLGKSNKKKYREAFYYLLVVLFNKESAFI